jgi:hypothetical protein
LDHQRTQSALRRSRAVRIQGGHLETRQDVGYHIGFLVGSLASSEPAYFRDYTHRLSGVVGARGGPDGTLGESLSLLQQFFEKWLPASASGAVSDGIKARLSALAEVSMARKRLYRNYLPTATAGVDILTDHLLTEDAAEARALVKRTASGGTDYLRLATRLLRPPLYAVGTLRDHNKISVAQEHPARAICQAILAELYRTADFAAPRHVLLRRRQPPCRGPAHGRGWLRVGRMAVEFLGNNLPVRVLQAKVECWRPELIGLSAATGTASSDHAPSRRCSVPTSARSARSYGSAI